MMKHDFIQIFCLRTVTPRRSAIVKGALFVPSTVGNTERGNTSNT